MKKIIDHSVGSSLLQFLKYRTEKDLEAFHTVTGELHRYVDSRFGLVAYGSPEAGWIYNTDIPGTVDPSIPGYDRGVSGMIAKDFINGRFLFSGNFPNIPLTGSYSVSELNYYLSSNSEAKLIFETKYQQSPVLNSDTGYLNPYDFICPCVFVKPFETNNEPFSLGGLDWTVLNYRIIGLMPNESYLAGLSKIVRDSRQEIFPLLQNFALNQYNDLKELSWNYPQYCEENQYYAFISDSTFKIEEPDIFTKENSKLFCGIGNIEVRIVRQPHALETDPNLDIVHALTDVDDIFDTDVGDRFILT